MTDGPKTPRTPSKPRASRKHAPKIPSPSGAGVCETPRPVRKDTKTPRPVNRPVKENVPHINEQSNGTSRKPRAGKRADETIPTLKAQTSREIAEIIALMRSVHGMKVIEVTEGTPVDPDTFKELMAMKVPVVFRQYAAEWRCVKHWSDVEYLRGAAVTEAAEFPHRKYRQFVARSNENGRLHLTDGKSKAKAVSIEEFLDHTDSTSDQDSLYLLGIHAVGNHAPLSYCPVQMHSDDNEVAPPLSKDVPSEVPILQWYAKLLAEKQKSKSPIQYDHQQFFLASGYAYTDLHYDSYDNFYVAVSGTRRWTLACPTASRWLIDSTSGKLKSGSSVVPHQGTFSKGSPAQVFPFAFVELKPGDVLFVPNCWWHLVESIPGKCGFSSAFNFFFSRPADEVFGEFQAGLSETDSIVNSLQSECRVKIAQASKTSGAIPEIPKHIQSAPGTVAQGLWNRMSSLAISHGVLDELESLHMLHSCNSTEAWDKSSVPISGRSGDEPKPEIHGDIRAPTKRVPVHST